MTTTSMLTCSLNGRLHQTLETDRILTREPTACLNRSKQLGPYFMYHVTFRRLAEIQRLISGQVWRLSMPRNTYITACHHCRKLEHWQSNRREDPTPAAGTDDVMTAQCEPTRHYRYCVRQPSLQDFAACRHLPYSQCKCRRKIWPWPLTFWLQCQSTSRSCDGLYV